MANQHTGNTQPAIDQEEHASIGGIDGKKVFIFDNSGNQITAFGLNTGTSKTLIPKNSSFAQASIATIAVPSSTFYITDLILNSNATVGLRIKSGATYLIGNVSISVSLNPGGGWVQHGSPDSPVYQGLADAAAIVLEKEDFGQIAEIAGHLMYYDE